MLRKTFLKWALTAFVFLPLTLAQAAPDELRFMVMGDWGKPLSKEQPHLPTAGQKQVAEAMARYAEVHKMFSPVQFVVLTGDNFYEGGVTGVDDIQWKTKFENVYDPKRLPMPFIAVLGNHDWRTNPSAQIAYAGVNGARLVDPGIGWRKRSAPPRPYIAPGTRWQMDGFYYKRTYPLPTRSEFDTLIAPTTPLTDFFFIDTDLWNYGLTKLADAQLKWLEAELKNSKATWQIVVAHHPLFTDGAHAPDTELVKLREILLPLFKKYGVDTFLAGHDHNLQHVINPAHPTTFIISGGGAETRPRKTNDFGEAFFSLRGFAGIVITPTELRGELIDDSNKSLHTWTQKPLAPTP
ncbi:MAG TPA: tartrate-resistant acid phosphatase type 5 family protein [Abditibacteriaceae bacterium]|jgi:3',5'-cyclic AMP phosphodiesterase CpdA